MPSHSSARETLEKQAKKTARLLRKYYENDISKLAPARIPLFASKEKKQEVIDTNNLLKAIQAKANLLNKATVKNTHDGFALTHLSRLLPALNAINELLALNPHPKNPYTQKVNDLKQAITDLLFSYTDTAANLIQLIKQLSAYPQLKLVSELLSAIKQSKITFFEFSKAMKDFKETLAPEQLVNFNILANASLNLLEAKSLAARVKLQERAPELFAAEAKARIELKKLPSLNRLLAEQQSISNALSKTRDLIASELATERSKLSKLKAELKTSTSALHRRVIDAQESANTRYEEILDRHGNCNGTYEVPEDERERRSAHYRLLKDQLDQQTKQWDEKNKLAINQHEAVIASLESSLDGIIKLLTQLSCISIRTDEKLAFNRVHTTKKALDNIENFYLMLRVKDSHYLAAYLKDLPGRIAELQSAITAAKAELASALGKKAKLLEPLQALRNSSYLLNLRTQITELEKVKADTTADPTVSVSDSSSLDELKKLKAELDRELYDIEKREASILSIPENTKLLDDIKQLELKVAELNLANDELIAQQTELHNLQQALSVPTVLAIKDSVDRIQHLKVINIRINQLRHAQNEKFVVDLPDLGPFIVEEAAKTTSAKMSPATKSLEEVVNPRPSAPPAVVPAIVTTHCGAGTSIPLAAVALRNNGIFANPLLSAPPVDPIADDENPEPSFRAEDLPRAPTHSLIPDAAETPTTRTAVLL